MPFTNIGTWKKIYSSKKHDEGLRLAALQVAESMLGDIRESDNIFDNLLEAFRKTGMNDSEGAVLMRAPFDPAHQIIRTDFAFAASGAVFGALDNGSTQTKKINVDRAIVKLLEDSNIREPLEKETAEKMPFGKRYIEFEKIFSPESALNSVLSE